MPNIFRTKWPTNFKLGTYTEDEDHIIYKRRDLQGQRSKSQGYVTRLTVLADKSRTKCPRNTKIGGKVVHLTCNNAYHFQGQTRPTNAEIGSVSYVPNGWAYELQTLCTDGARRPISP